MESWGQEGVGENQVILEPHTGKVRSLDPGSGTQNY